MSKCEGEATTYSYEKEVKSDNTLTPVETTQDAEIVDLEDSRNGQFHRSFTPRQVHVCAFSRNMAITI